MITEEIKEVMESSIETTLDFCGSTVDACRQICVDYGISYNDNIDTIEAIRFETIQKYHKKLDR